MATILKNHYVLAVPDASATARYFVDVLGFKPVPVGDDFTPISQLVRQSPELLGPRNDRPAIGQRASSSGDEEPPF